MRTRVWMILGLWLLAAVPAAMGISGFPFADESVTGTTTVTKGITANLCRVGGLAVGQETPMLVQIASNAIYYSLASTTATPGSYGAPQYYAATGDVIEVGQPTKFRMIGVTAGVTYRVSVTCFVR